jgi:hypothetical protein
VDGKIHAELAAIDAGATECAVALYTGQRLRMLWALPTDRLRANLRCDRAVYEIPQADGRGAPADDLIRTAVGGAKVAAWLASEVVEYQPRQWKGSLPKAAHHHQAWTLFTEAEQALLGGATTLAAIERACERGASARWQKRGALAGNHFYSDRELPIVGGLKITHDLLDAASLGLHDLGRTRTLTDSNAVKGTK